MKTAIDGMLDGTNWDTTPPDDGWTRDRKLECIQRMFRDVGQEMVSFWPQQVKFWDRSTSSRGFAAVHPAFEGIDWQHANIESGGLLAKSIGRGTKYVTFCAGNALVLVDKAIERDMFNREVTVLFFHGTNQRPKDMKPAAKDVGFDLPLDVPQDVPLNNWSFVDLAKRLLLYCMFTSTIISKTIMISEYDDVKDNFEIDEGTLERIVNAYANVQDGWGQDRWVQRSPGNVAEYEHPLPHDRRCDNAMGKNQCEYILVNGDQCCHYKARGHARFCSMHAPRRELSMSGGNGEGSHSEQNQGAWAQFGEELQDLQKDTQSEGSREAWAQLSEAHKNRFMDLSVVDETDNAQEGPERGTAHQELAHQEGEPANTPIVLNVADVPSTILENQGGDEWVEMTNQMYS